MILILTSSDDISTNEVIDWLIFNKAKYLRINHEDIVEINYIQIPEYRIDITIHFENKTKKINLNLNKISSFWYRRGDFNLKMKLIDKKDNLSTKVNVRLQQEINELYNFLHLYLKNNSISLNFVDDNNTNKLNNLVNASKIGLSIPKTFILSSKHQIKELDMNNLITKPIGSGVIYFNDFYIGGYTEITGNLKDYNTIFPSLFQENIDKKYELRVFHLNGKNYCSAIFSQNDEKTKVDFRKYNTEKKNRVVPFKLSKNINTLINKFMKKSNLNSGSLDILVDKNNNYFFLEVNPIGQFKQVSLPCNYYLEEKIALTLLN